MIQNEKDAELTAVISVAANMCAAARTAPKTKGDDFMHSCILFGEEIEMLAAKMEEMAEPLGYKFFLRDAGNIRASQAVVLLGMENKTRGLGAGCGYCGFKDCGACQEAGGACAYGPMDLGIAIGAAVSVASAAHIDNRVMFSAGRCAREMGLFDEAVTEVIAIPLSVSGKSPYFDRSRK